MISPSLASAVPPPQYPSEVDGDTTDTAFFVKSVDLYEIIHRTIRSLYHGARCDEEPVDLAVVMQLGSALQKWEKGLPERLKGTSTQPRSLVTHRQTVILNLRYIPQLLHLNSRY